MARRNISPWKKLQKTSNSVLNVVDTTAVTIELHAQSFQVAAQASLTESRLEARADVKDLLSEFKGELKYSDKELDILNTLEEEFSIQ